jgi:hypothetical protein
MCNQRGVIARCEDWPARGHRGRVKAWVSSLKLEWAAYIASVKAESASCMVKHDLVVMICPLNSCPLRFLPFTLAQIAVITIWWWSLHPSQLTGGYGVGLNFNMANLASSASQVSVDSAHLQLDHRFHSNVLNKQGCSSQIPAQAFNHFHAYWSLIMMVDFINSAEVSSYSSQRLVQSVIQRGTLGELQSGDHFLPEGFFFFFICIAMLHRLYLEWHEI